MPFVKAKIEKQRGMSLVEVMVGLLLGLLGVLVITQVYVFYEGRKRTTASGADATTGGTIALTLLQRDVQSAGYGLSPATMVGLSKGSLCIVDADTNGKQKKLNGKPLLPFLIIPDGLDAGDAANPLGIPPGDKGSDMIAIVSSAGDNVVEGVLVGGIGGTTLTFDSGSSDFSPNDNVLVMATDSTGGMRCSLAKISDIAGLPVSVTLSHSLPWGGGLTVNYNAGARVFNLGQQTIPPANADTRGLNFKVYAVRYGTLTLCDFWTSDCTSGLPSAPGGNATWVPVASNIVGLRAQYGWDTSASLDMVPDAYCRERLDISGNCTGNDDDSPATKKTPPSSACDITRIVSVRLALVARSDNPENADVSDASIPLWPAITTPVAQAATFSVDNIESAPGVTNPNNRRYRYKVFQTVIPLRNTIWTGVQPCP